MRHFNNIVTCGLTLGLAPAAFAGGSITLNPANNIQATINSGLYSEIILEPGNYNQLITINAADAPLTLRSTDPSNPATVDATILDGTFLARSVILLNSGVGSDVLIDGLSMQNGEATTGADRGGAIDCEDADPTIRRCVFLNNHADSAGGAFYVNAGNLTLEDCRFEGNDATNGGAAYCNNSIVNFVRCQFEQNDASVEGGGVRLFGGTYTFEQCSFVDNESVQFGGAFATRSNAMWSAGQCWFESNFSGDGGSNGRGGAIYHDGNDSAWMENSVFRNNECSNFGSSVYTLQTLTVRNCTHYGDVGNDVYDVPSSGHVTMHNTILWNFSNGSITGAGGKSVTHSTIQGGFAGAGNRGADSGDEPSFADAASGDFHLLDGSAGIDAGDATKVLGQYPVDYEGNPRALDDPDTADSGVAVLGISVDMGAYEFQPEPAGPPNDCAADLNGDDVVNVLDLLLMLGAWGGC